jgi:STE24 endopeptidase
MSFIQWFNSLFDFVDKIDKNVLFYSIIGFMTVMFLWEQFLSLRQFLIERKTKQVPSELTSVLDDKTFQKSRLYAIDKRVYGFANNFYSQTESYLILFLGALPFVWRASVRQVDSLGVSWLTGSEIAHSILFVTYFMLFSTVTSLPWSIYYTFVLEEKHGFNKQTFGFFVKDNIKKLLVSIVLTFPILALLLFIIRIGGDYFFIYAWLFITVVSLFMITIYADFIAPLFDKYVPLPAGDLRTKIEELAKSLSFPLYKLYVVEGSKRSSHSNAYMYGFYKSKRIVLFDTLIEGYVPATRTDDKGNKTKLDFLQASYHHRIRFYQKLCLGIILKV